MNNSLKYLSTLLIIVIVMTTMFFEFIFNNYITDNILKKMQLGNKQVITSAFSRIINSDHKEIFKDITNKSNLTIQEDKEFASFALDVIDFFYFNDMQYVNIYNLKKSKIFSNYKFYIYEDDEINSLVDKALNSAESNIKIIHNAKTSVGNNIETLAKIVTPILDETGAAIGAIEYYQDVSGIFKRAIKLKWYLIFFTGIITLCFIAAYVSYQYISRRSIHELENNISKLSNEITTVKLAYEKKLHIIHNALSQLSTGIKNANEITLYYQEETFGNHLPDYKAYTNDLQIFNNDSLELIENIKSLTTLYLDLLPVQLILTDARKAINAILKLLHFVITERNINLKISFMEEPNMVYVDYNILKQILFYILSNTAKHTPSNHTIEIITESVEINKVRYLNIKIIDNGIGIATFQNASSQLNAKDLTSTYIAITEKLVQAINGEIKFENNLGHGSIVTLTLPLKSANTSI